MIYIVASDACCKNLGDLIFFVEALNLIHAVVPMKVIISLKVLRHIWSQLSKLNEVEAQIIDNPRVSCHYNLILLMRCSFLFYVIIFCRDTNGVDCLRKPWASCGKI